MVGFLVVGGLVGAGLAYWWLASRRLKGYQSRARWIPALVAGGKVGELVLLVVTVVAGAALGVGAGATLVALLDAQAR